MRRREFITILGGAAIVWPLSAHAQQTERVRRIGVLSGTAPGDQETQDRIAAFQQRLQQLGWIDGRNMRIDHRVWAGDLALARRYAAELVALAPDAILAGGGTSLRSLFECDEHCADRVRERHRSGRVRTSADHSTTYA